MNQIVQSGEIVNSSREYLMTKATRPVLPKKKPQPSLSEQLLAAVELFGVTDTTQAIKEAKKK